MTEDTEYCKTDLYYDACVDSARSLLDSPNIHILPSPYSSQNISFPHRIGHFRISADELAHLVFLLRSVGRYGVRSKYLLILFPLGIIINKVETSKTSYLFLAY